MSSSAKKKMLLDDIYHTLSDPHLVAKIQQHFGVEDNTNNNGPTKASSDVIIRNKPLYYMFLFMTQLGDELVGSIFMPMLIWHFDDTIMCLAYTCWCVCMFTGNVIKDVVQLPRPSYPPVLNLEKYNYNNENEYGMPSTHTTAITSITYTFVALLFQGYAGYDYQAASATCFNFFLVCVAVVLCVLVATSRLYLGVHTLFDVLVGFAVGLIMSYIFVRVASHFDAFIHRGLLYGVAFNMLLVLACTLYPKVSHWSTARPLAFKFLGIAGGLVLGMSLKHSLKLLNMGKYKSQLIIQEEVLSSTMSSSSLLNNIYAIFLLRSLVGYVILLASKIYVARFILYLATFVYNIPDNVDAKEFSKQNFTLELVYCYFTYCVGCFNIIFSTFLVFKTLHLT